MSTRIGSRAMLEDIRVVVEERGLVEGPRLGDDGSVWFSDVTLGGVYRDSEVVVPKRRGVGGLVLHEDGGVVLTGRTLLHRTAAGEDRLLLAREDVTGFNDLIALDDGSLLVGALREGMPGLVLHVEAAGSARVISDSLAWPNGIAVGGDVVYVCDFGRGHVVRMALDGSGAEVFWEAPRGSCDGCALDAEGGLWVALGHGGAVARGHQVFDLPAEFVSTIAFNGHDVLIATMGALLRARCDVAGAAVPLARL
jgi:sugar lactone lactonase YvrE